MTRPTSTAPGTIPIPAISPARLAALVVLGLAAITGCPAAPAGDGTDASDAGIAFDLQAFIDRQLAAGDRRVVIPPGRYRVSPRNRQHLLLDELAGVEIVATGVEMICTETTRALTLRNCRNLTLRGLTIDYDPLPFTQGRITRFTGGGKVHEIELFDGYPAARAARNFKYEIFRPDTRTLRCDDRYPERIEAVDERHLRVIFPQARNDQPEQVGDLIVIGAEYAPQGSIPHAVECEGNVNVRLEDLTLFASNCFGFLEHGCDASTYLRCRIDRRPAATDPLRLADPRLRSLDADAFHSKHALKGPAYLACEARFMGDDAININGDYHMVMEARGRELRVLAKHRMNIAPGDPVELVAYSGLRLPDARVLTVDQAATIRDEERAFLSRQHMDAGLKAARGALQHAWTIRLDREVELPTGSLICAANRIGNGFRVNDCRFGFNRSRGILIKASHGEVSGNRIEGSRMHAILVSPEYWWLEAGSSCGVSIRDNRIRNCGGVPILVQATGGSGAIAPAGAHRDITITGNHLSGCAMPGILATSTAGLRIEGNTFDGIVADQALPGLMRQAGIQDRSPVVRINCQPAVPEPDRD